MKLFKKRNKKHSSFWGGHADARIGSDAGQASMTMSWIVRQRRICLWHDFLLLAMTIVFAFPFSSHAQPVTPANKYPRTANVYLSTIEKSDYDKLAQYDLLVLIPEIQFYNPDFFAYARAKNPNIIILPYIYSGQLNIEGQDDIYSSLKRDFAALATPERYLYSPEHNKIDIWRNALFLMNPKTDWVEVMPKLVKEKILDTGLWDGIFYDEFDASITHFSSGNIDINNDGSRDEPAVVNRQWQEGMVTLLENTRKLIGEQYYIVINGDSLASYQPEINGRMFESFPTPWEGRGAWLDSMRSYFQLSKENRTPNTTIINTTAAGRGDQYSYSLMRYGLASTLLGNGYSSYNQGMGSHAQAWLYDEYAATLGSPVAQMVNVLKGGTDLAPSLWRRDFAQGAVFVNATDEPQQLSLTQDFERVHGLQDPTVNTGEITNEVTLRAKDGILLMKPLEKITGTPFINGAFARVFTTRGIIKRTGFFSYNSLAPGGATIIQLSPAESPWIRTIAAVANRLEYFDDVGKRVRSILPYGEKFKGSLTFAIGDIAGDGRRQIVAIPLTGGSLHIRSFTLNGGAGTVNANVTTERVNKHSIAIIPGSHNMPGSIVIGAGARHRPIVSIYRTNGTLVTTWGAFEGSFLSGVSVAVLDSPTPTVVVGRNAPGKAEVRLFDRSGKLQGLFFAFRPAAQNGVTPAISDVDGDGIPELMALTTQ